MTQYCKKIKFGDIENPTVVFGLYEEQDENFVRITTAKRSVVLNKSIIISVEETERPFKTFNNQYKNEGVWS